MNKPLRILFGCLGVMAAVCLTGQAALAQEKPKTRADSHVATQGQQCLYIIFGDEGEAAAVTWPPKKLLSKLVDLPNPDFCSSYPYNRSDDHDYENNTILPGMLGSKLIAFDAQGVPVGRMKIRGVSRLGGCTDPDMGYVLEKDLDDATKYKSSETPRFATGLPLLPAAEVRPATPEEQDKARAFMLSTGQQLGIPPRAFSPPEKKTDEDGADPKYGLTLSFVDFNHDGLPDLIGTFLHEDYSMLVIARNTGDGFVAENKKVTIRPPATSIWSYDDDFPPSYSYYASFNVGDADDLIAIDKLSAMSYEEIMILRRNTDGRWSIDTSTTLNSGCD